MIFLVFVHIYVCIYIIRLMMMIIFWFSSVKRAKRVHGILYLAILLHLVLTCILFSGFAVATIVIFGMYYFCSENW